MLSQFTVISKYLDSVTIIFLCLLLMTASLIYLASDAYHQVKVEEGGLPLRTIDEYYLYASFFVVLGCGYPIAHNALLGILSSQLRNNKLIPFDRDRIFEETTDDTGTTTFSSGAVFNGWFVFYGDLAKSVVPLVAGYILERHPHRYDAIFAGTATLLFASVIGMVVHRRLLET